MPFSMRTRLSIVEKTQVDLMDILTEKGIPIDKTTSSLAVNEKRHSPKIDKVRSLYDEIIAKWEQGSE